MPVPLQQAIVVVLSTALLALVTAVTFRTASGARRILLWLALWLSLAPPVGVGVYLVQRKRDPAFARAALLIQTAGVGATLVLVWLGAGEG